MKSLKQLLFCLALSLPLSHALGHCQIPCGIYADDVVFGELMTDVATIEKAMNQINTLGKTPSESPNQLVRWVTNKEQHAQNIQEVMAAYFLAQRITFAMREADPEKYNRLLELCHQVTVLAMKCKQTTDLDNARQLHDALHAFQQAYAAK